MQTIDEATWKEALANAFHGNHSPTYYRVARIVRRADDPDRALTALEAAFGGGREAAVQMLERLADR